MRELSLVFLLCSAGLLQAASYTNGQAARAVLGQGVFTDGTVGPPDANNNPTTTQYLLGGASGLAYYNNRLYVADDNTLGATPEDNRVVVFDTTQIPGLYDDPTNFAHPSNRCWVCGYIEVGLIGQPDYRGLTSGRAAAPTATAGSLNQPVGVATDGQHFAVADVNNNRVLLWNSIPASQNTPADVVLGQKDGNSFQTPQIVNANSLRGPQGVWFQNGKLFVADTQNYRVLVWNSTPTTNNQPADFVLGQPNLSSANHPPATTESPATNASQLLNPVAVTSDGTHLFVADLGNNRVLIWNSIPSSNGQPADVVIGQPSMTTSNPNNATGVCPSLTSDSTGKPLYPALCQSTLNFPRFALAAGGKLYIADAGNDRVLVFNSIPTSNGAPADNVLGQPDPYSDIVTNVAQSIASTTIDNTASVDTIQAPTSLAWDGNNLYVADPFNRRVVVYTPADIYMPGNSVVNWASEIIRQEGEVVFAGTPVANDTATVTIAGTAYTYTVVSKDTTDSIARGIVSKINAGSGDPNVLAIFSGPGSGGIYLSSKQSNLGFDGVSLAATTSNATNVTATASGGFLTAGTAATGSPGMLMEINAYPGTSLSDTTLAPTPPAYPGGMLPTTLGGVQVLVDGIPAPILSVSPSQIVFQVSYTVLDRSSISVSVINRHNGGSPSATTANPVYIAPANPGLFNQPAYAGQTRPWPAKGALHQLGNPSAVISVDGTVKAADIATITIAGKAYNYTVVATDTLATITQNLINLINASDPNVTASAGAAFTRVVLTAKQSGAAGNGISVAGSANTGASVSLTAYNTATCCDVPQGQPISALAPAVPGETITLLAAGLGALSDPNAQAGAGYGGQAFIGVTPNNAAQSVSATMNGVTAQVVSAGLPTYSFGIFQVQMIVPASVGPTPAAQVYIAQNAFISNTVTIPVAAAGSVITIYSPGAGLSNTQVVVSPFALTFPAQALGGTNPAQTVTIQNPSASQPLAISSIVVTGAGAANFNTSSTCTAVLAPASSCQVSVSFVGTNGGSTSANLSVLTNASTSPQIVPLNAAPASAFEIVSVATGKAVDISAPANFATVVENDLLATQSQRWQFIPVGNNVYAIFNTASGKALDVRDANPANGALIQQYDYYGYPNQQWTLVPQSNGSYSIVSVGTGKALDMTSGLTANGTTLQQWAFYGGVNQQFQLIHLTPVSIQSVASPNVLDVVNGSTADQALVQQWVPNGDLQQTWYFIPVDATYYKIVSANSGKCLDVTNYSLAPTAPIQQFTCTGATNQQWALSPTGASSYSIVNKNSGRVLDVTGASTVSGSLVQQYDYVGGQNQQWTLVPSQAAGQ